MPSQAQAEALQRMRDNRWAQKQLDDEDDFERFSLLEMLGNAPGDAVEVGKDIYQTVAHPIDTLSAVGNLALGGAQKLIPGEQDSEKYAEAFYDGIVEKYGSWDKFLNTLENEPVHTLMDISPVGGLAGQVMKASKLPIVAGAGNTLTKASMAVDPTNLAMAAPKGAAKAYSKMVDPVDQYKSAAKFSTVLDKKGGVGTREKLAETALKEEIPLSEKGVQKLDTRLTEVGQLIEDIIDTADSTGQRVPLDAIGATLGNVRKEYGGFRHGADKNLGIIDETWSKFQDEMLSKGYDTVGVKELQDFKKALHKELNWDKRKLSSRERAEDATLREMDRAARKEIEGLVPDVKDANRLYGDLKELRDPLIQSVGRIGNRNPYGSIDMPLNTSAGAQMGQAAGGDIGGLIVGGIGAARGAMSVPQVQGWLAQKGYNLRNTRLQDLFLNQNPYMYSGRNIMQQLGEERREQERLR